MCCFLFGKFPLLHVIAVITDMLTVLMTAVVVPDTPQRVMPGWLPQTIPLGA